VTVRDGNDLGYSTDWRSDNLTTLFRSLVRPSPEHSPFILLKSFENSGL